MTEFTTLLQQGNARFFIPSAILLGALHGLEPGHSKTMMAAFIIAIKGTIKQAVMLGLAATISHTAVVWLIAFGGMVISKRFTAQSAEPWLQLISAVIIISTAFWMFWRTGAANATGWRICTSMIMIMSIITTITKITTTMDIITITNMASIRMPMHEPMPMTLNDALMVEVTNWQILLFGLTGGLIPCPAAITVLLICIQLKALTLGATLVVSFSLGFGVNACHRRRWRSNQRSAGRKTLERI